MLHINKITIRNFRPYYGINEFTFGNNDGLSIILGDNGIGKSSLIRAIKYVLYNEFDNSNSFQVKDEINILAWEEGNYEMYVALEFMYNGAKYILKRFKRVKPSVAGEPTSDNDFEDLPPTLIRDSIVLSPNETKEILNNIIPKKISEYILFEGETIAKYKDLLDKNKNLEIYESIRKILGITTLENSKSDLEYHLDKLKKEKIKLVKDDDRNKSIRKELDKLQDSERIYNEELEQAIQDKEGYLKSKTDAEYILKENQRIRDLINTKQGLQNDIKSIEGQINNDKELIKSLLKNYKSIPYDIIETYLKTVPSNITSIKHIIDQNKQHEEEIKTLENLIGMKECKYCGSHLGSNEQAKIINDIGTLKSKLHLITVSDLNLVEDYNQRMKVIEQTMKNVPIIDFVNEIQSRELEIQKKMINRDNLVQQLSNVKTQISESGGEGDLEQIVTVYTQSSINIDKCQKIIDDCNIHLSEIKSKISDILKKIPQKIDFSKLDYQIDLTEKLILIFEKSIAEYSEAMRIKVQQDASTLFKNISENQDYERLEFDKNYGLRLIDKQNRIVPNISSGYMTLITISLIYGLHKNSSLTGTIILDAPFSVLTNFHRDKIIRTFQSLSPQVILLVYRDQIDLNSIRQTMQHRLVNEIEIYQDRSESNSSYRTHVR